MGYSSQVISDLKHLGISPGASIGDCGSQDFAAAQIEDLNLTIKNNYGASPFPVGRILPAVDVFTRLGMNYTAFDVDGRKGTVYLDFHSLQFPRNLYDKFDATFNAGTSEHLLVPSGLFFFMHQATKVGGLMWHHVPVFGWGNHGMTNHTPKFWHQLAAYNQYEVVKASVVKVDTSFVDPGNFYGEHLSYFQGLMEFETPSAMIEVIFRKKFPYCFVPPFDIDNPSPSPLTERLMRGALQPFVDAGSLDISSIDQAMDWRFGRGPREAEPLPIPEPLSLMRRIYAKANRMIPFDISN